MKKSMYGTRDAASNRERDWQGHVRELGLSTGTQLKESVSPQREPSVGFDTPRRLRAHMANKETDGVREEDDECVSNQSEDHRLWITEEHQNVEQEIALGESEESCINMIPDTLTCL